MNEKNRLLAYQRRREIARKIWEVMNDAIADCAGTWDDPIAVEIMSTFSNINDTLLEAASKNALASIEVTMYTLPYVPGLDTEPLIDTQKTPSNLDDLPF